MLGDKVQSAEFKIKEAAETSKAAKLIEEKAVKANLAAAVERGRTRPMLLSSYNATATNKHEAQLATAKRFMEVLLESGLTYNKALEHMSQNEKELLEEAKFVDARKKQYGRM